MTAKLFGIKNCDTMKKAWTWLDQHGVAYEFHDYKTAGVDRATLQDWAGKVWFLAPTLDDPSIVSPTGHYYISHQQPWVKLNDGLPTFEKF